MIGEAEFLLVGFRSQVSGHRSQVTGRRFGVGVGIGIGIEIN